MILLYTYLEEIPCNGMGEVVFPDEFGQGEGATTSGGGRVQVSNVHLCYFRPLSVHQKQVAMEP